MPSKIFEILEKEEKRQKETINLIPSENFVSEDVLRALGSVFTNKYAEGKPHHRYYAGNEFVDELEDEVVDLVHRAFNIHKDEYSVNVQPYSGSIANIATYFGVLNVNDEVLSMSLEHGGHLTHGHTASITGKIFEFEHYGVGEDGYINYDQVKEIAKRFQPKLIIAGTSAYPRTLDYKKFKEIADSVNALLMADIAHIAGLIVGGAHPSPFPYADIVTTTTHKTLRGPRSAIIICKKNLADNIDKTVFPGIQGGPHMNAVAATGVALEEALRPEFKDYAQQVVKNAKALAEELKNLGFQLVSGGTDNHLILVDVTPLGLTGQQASDKLEKEGVIVNKNMIPFDTRKAWDPSGIRLGTPAVTTQGMKEKDMTAIAKRIAEILISKS
ncbi:MAG: serine hydroxymethyltransferase [Candidatus Yanofskybacteria bacterium RIFCSPHIGHO2_02_FULL_41_29]|uniref:Serine hydroxymethyltransferase n=1 Tax=Candidatus Yanofskybacteria bacterium RIFCSPHIGHO2_01_FULL_41_53 TaxID=1802663 RepID=A0A1F8ENC7_9BACT|nr:MAG: serine hydroxymethyltransferase [Candidatus Yanofskybacteria bacterium RIFCSPHIGHO2_01_FULL_41_53]OGN10420.1 MAG: serine hydroxymethyltransferase [Candidatus Yanofskybacteria bacterium RIFCSPHIGHO2_02_FULL_41_29]OGN18412.1 MAG: serine hydroxymethyltransferase [Candidatus Yanofskybacteria bacterium RIFCSPHIGHO2_12_FULL_41_9]OGN21163.1 MAG: serine hydroxymethyltransferase [Candidatus Yanofskybacteria bacterium RIFCSPLOWO2_01_FULL_41_67]OGN30063.1 MAG: serine hydroxymethyltransferase [Cand